MDDLMKMMLAAMTLAKDKEDDTPIDVCTVKITLSKDSLEGSAKYPRPLIELLGDEGEAWMEETSKLLRPIISVQTGKFENLLEKKSYINRAESVDIKID